MIRAVIFDFNGVIVDDEPVHFKLFQKVLEEEGMTLTKEDYYSKYLGMDDADCFTTAAGDQGKKLSEEELHEWIERKAGYYQEAMKSNPPIINGVVSLIQELAQTHYVAIVSGALRREVEGALDILDLRDAISLIVAAEDVSKGKPDSEGFETALSLLNRDFVASSERLLPEECIVIEDSSWGIEAASLAAMPCVGITSSFKPEEMPGALMYLSDFSGISGDALLKQVNGKLKEGS